MGGRGGEVSDPPLGHRNDCIRYLYQGKIPGKISSGYIFHPPPHIMLYIFQDTWDVYITSGLGFHAYCPTSFVSSGILILSIDTIGEFIGNNILYIW